MISSLEHFGMQKVRVLLSEITACVEGYEYTVKIGSLHDNRGEIALELATEFLLFDAQDLC